MLEIRCLSFYLPRFELAQFKFKDRRPVHALAATQIIGAAKTIAVRVGKNYYHAINESKKDVNDLKTTTLGTGIRLGTRWEARNKKDNN